MTKNNSPAELHCLILAAGSSKRLGKPKQLIEFEGKTLLERTCRLGLSQTHQVHVVISSQAPEKIRHVLSSLPVDIIINKESQQGMASSLRCGITTLPHTAHGLLVLLVDQYLIETAQLQSLVTNWQKQPKMICAASYNNIIGVPVIWPAHFFPELKNLQGDRGARDLLRKNRHTVIQTNLPSAATDLDTPEQELAAQQSKQQ